MATYQQCERGILIYHESQWHSTDAQVQCRLYWSSLCGEDTDVSCPSRQVRYWLLTGFQPSIKCQYAVKYTHSPTSMAAALLESAIFCPVAQQIHHFMYTHDRGVCKKIKLTWLSDASVDFRIPNFGLLYHIHIEDDWGQNISGLLLRDDQNVLIDSTFIELQNWLSYKRQPFHWPTSVECLGLDCKVE